MEYFEIYAIIVPRCYVFVHFCIFVVYINLHIP